MSGRLAMMVVAALAPAVAAPRPARAEVQLWTELGARLEAGRRVEVDLDQQLRFDADVSRVGAVIPEASASIRIARWLRAGGGYRLEYERDKAGDMVVRHRVFGDARARVALGHHLRAEHRLQVQDDIRPDRMDVHRPEVRLRLTVSYRGARPWVPAASVETFHRNGDPRIDKVWLTLGGARTGPREVETFYRIELASGAPAVSIIGLAFHAEP
jgi:hypothetical protein